MKKFLLFILILQRLIIYSQEIDFKQSISYGSWGYYCDQESKGPFFLDNETIIYIDEYNTLNIADITGNTIFTKKLSSWKSKLYKGYENYYIEDNNNMFIFTNNEMEKSESNILITEDIMFSKSNGLYYINHNNKKEMIIPEMLNMDIKDIPKLDNSGKFIYFIDKKDHLSGDLYKYSLLTKKLEKVNENIGSFSYLNNDEMLLYKVHSQNTILMFNEFPGDFFIFDTKTNKELFNSDLISFENNYEYSISSFDSNESGLIVAFGAYITVKNNMIDKNESSIILMEYLE